MSVSNLNISALSLATTVVPPTNEGTTTVWEKLTEDGVGKDIIDYAVLWQISDDVKAILTKTPGKYSFVVHIPNNHFGPTQQQWVLQRWVEFGANVVWNCSNISIVVKGNQSVIVHWIIGASPMPAITTKKPVEDEKTTTNDSAALEGLEVKDNSVDVVGEDEDLSADGGGVDESSYEPESEVESSFESAYGVGFTQEVSGF